ncbi:Hydrazine synthase subunit beta [subsurface metagenome]
MGEKPKIIKVSPDEKWVYVSNWGSASVSVIDVALLSVIKEIDVGRKPRGIAFTPDGKFAYIANMGESSLSKIDVKNGHKKIKYLPAGLTPRHLVVTKNGAYLYQTNNLEEVVRKLDLMKDRYVGIADVGKRARSCVLSPSEKYLFVCNYMDNEIGVVDTDKMVQIYSVKTGDDRNGHPIGITISNGGEYLWVSNYRGGVNIYRIIWGGT